MADVDRVSALFAVFNGLGTAICVALAITPSSDVYRVCINRDGIEGIMSLKTGRGLIWIF